MPLVGSHLGHCRLVDKRSGTTICTVPNAGRIETIMLPMQFSLRLKAGHNEFSVSNFRRPDRYGKLAELYLDNESRITLTKTGSHDRAGQQTVTYEGSRLPVSGYNYFIIYRDALTKLDIEVDHDCVLTVRYVYDHEAEQRDTLQREQTKRLMDHKRDYYKNMGVIDEAGIYDLGDFIMHDEDVAMDNHLKAQAALTQDVVRDSKHLIKTHDVITGFEIMSSGACDLVLDTMTGYRIVIPVAPGTARYMLERPLLLMCTAFTPPSVYVRGGQIDLPVRITPLGVQIPDVLKAVVLSHETIKYKGLYYCQSMGPMENLPNDGGL